MFKTITFTKEPKDSPNKRAKLDKMGNGNYHVVNANMPFCGSINEVWTPEKLRDKIKTGIVTIDRD